ncbi:hypothetical protein vseg_012640 [Gypsophila vaccaria]
MWSSVVRRGSSSSSSSSSSSKHRGLDPIFYSTMTLSPPTSHDTAVNRAVSILTNQRSKSRWSSLLSVFPDGLTPLQISQVILLLRNNPRLALRFFHFSTLRFHSSSTSLLSYATIIHVSARARLRSHAHAHTLLMDSIRASPDRHHFHLFKLLVDTYRVCDSSPFVFDSLILSLLDLHHFDSCLLILRAFKSRPNPVSISTFNALISASYICKGCFFAYHLFHQLFSHPTPSTTCRLLPNVHTFNHLLLSFHRSAVLDMVEQVWIDMLHWNCSPNCCSYAILMEAYCEAGDIHKALTVWEELKLKGLQPDIVAFNTLIGGYCKVGDVDKGEQLYKEMVFTGVEPTCVTYQHLVNGHCLAGDADSAMLLYTNMRRKGYSPDTSNVDALVSMLCDKRCPLEAFGFFMAVTDNADFVVRETTYKRLIKSLCSVGKMEEALKLQAQMVGKGFRPNADTYDIFIDGYVKQGKLDVADSLRKEFTAMLARGVETENRKELSA